MTKRKVFWTVGKEVWAGEIVYAGSGFSKDLGTVHKEDELETPVQANARAFSLNAIQQEVPVCV
jgi:hypothetical protein